MYLMFIDSFVDVRGSIGDRSNFEENLTLTRQQFMQNDKIAGKIQ